MFDLAALATADRALAALALRTPEQAVASFGEEAETAGSQARRIDRIFPKVDARRCPYAGGRG